MDATGEQEPSASAPALLAGRYRLGPRRGSAVDAAFFEAVDEEVARRRNELVELMLRTLQSFIVDPGTPPRSARQLRRYLHRWIGPAVAPSAALTP